MVSARDIKAGAAYVEIYTRNSRLVRGLYAAQRRLKAFGKAVRNMGIRMAAAGVIAMAPMLAAAKLFAKMGDTVGKMAKRTGISVEALSELGFAAEQSGADIEMFEKGVKTMQRAVYDAGRELATQVDALADLALTFNDLKDLSPEKQFKLIADRLGKLADPTKRAAIAAMLLGRAGTRLLPMMLDGAAGIEKLQAQARALGLTITTEAAAAAEVLTDRVNILRRVLKATAFVVGHALVPSLEAAVNWMVKGAVRAGSWVKQNKQLARTIFKVTGAVIAGGVATIVLGTLISSLGSIFGLAAGLIIAFGKAIAFGGAVLALMLTPMGMLITAATGLGAALIYTSGAGGAALSWLGRKFGTLKDDAAKAIGAIGAALAAGDIKLAAEILWATLKVAWAQGIVALKEAWTKFKQPFINVAYELAYGAKAAWEWCVHAMRNVLIEGTAAMKMVWARFMSWHAESVNRMANWFAKRWMEVLGIFDKTIDVDRAKKYIDKISAKELAKIKATEQAELKKAGAVHKRAIALSDKEHEKKMADLEKEKEADIDAQKALGDQKIETAREGLRLLRAKRDLLVKEGREAGAGAADETNTLSNAMGDLANALRQAAADKISIAGTFGAAAAERMGGGAKAAERTARASEETAKNTAAIVREGVKIDYSTFT